jgi:hypothetical protein
VADVCPHCRAVTLWVVIDHFSQSHLYGVGLGESSYIGADRRCARCSAAHPYVEPSYADLLSQAEAQELPFLEAVTRCNPSLGAKLSLGHRLRTTVSGDPYRSADTSPELLQRALDLAEAALLAGVDVEGAFGRLAQWETMDTVTRTRLVDDFERSASALSPFRQQSAAAP